MPTIIQAIQRVTRGVIIRPIALLDRRGFLKNDKITFLLAQVIRFFQPFRRYTDKLQSHSTLRDNLQHYLDSISKATPITAGMIKRMPGAPAPTK